MRLARGLSWAVLALGLCAALASWGLWRWLDAPLSLKSSPVEVSIERGTTPMEVARLWVAAGLDVSPRALYEYFRWSGEARRLRAGSYSAEAGITPRQLLAKMVQGDETLERVRLPEGWTFRQFRQALARSPSLRAASAGLSDAELMARLGAPGQSPEGRFFPDTYAYSRGVSDLAVLRRAMQAMDRHVQAVWAARAPDLPLRSPQEVLILASIVEKETGLDSDRPLVAGVFANRLRIGMPLQTDPTVIYGLGEAFDGNLRKRDLQTDTPYNTYTRGGLPPTPIAMPGLASLRAAVQPASTKALYFVARGDGSTVFSDNLAAHERAVDQFQRRRRDTSP